MKKILSSILVASLTISLSIIAEAKVSNNVMENVLMIASLDENENPVMTGTGFLISSSGHILTNEHVIHDGESFAFCKQMPKQSTSECHYDHKLKLLAKDAKVDLALLQLPAGLTTNGKQKSNYLTLGNSDLSQIGDEISVIGYPGTGLYTVNLVKGVISGFAGDYIKTDARLFLGNSGSPALNGKYQVVGIATALTSDDYQSLGLLISSNTARNWLESVGFSSQSNEYTKSKVKPSVNIDKCFEKKTFLENFAYCTYKMHRD